MPFLDRTQFYSPSDSSEIDWIESELSSDFGTVGAVVPARYEAFIRIFHPAATADGAPAQWADVAKSLGRVMHPKVQWHALVGSSDAEGLSGSEWKGEPPDRGGVPRHLLEPLIEIIGSMSRSELCYLGLWAGWTAVSTSMCAANRTDNNQRLSVRRGRDLPGLHFELPRASGREFSLLRGPLAATSEVLHALDPSLDGGSLIHLAWPADRSWYLGSDIDWDSSVLGGSAELVHRVSCSNVVESLRIEPTDRLTADADEVNP